MDYGLIIDMLMLQVNSAYFGCGPSRGSESLPLANQGNQTPPVLNDTYRSYRAYESRIANPGLGTDPYQTCGVGGPYYPPNVESRNFTPGGATSPYQRGMVELYPRPPFSAYGEHTGFPGQAISHGNPQASRQSTFVPGHSSTYGRFLYKLIYDDFSLVFVVCLSGVVLVFATTIVRFRTVMGNFRTLIVMVITDNMALVLLSSHWSTIELFV